MIQLPEISNIGFLHLPDFLHRHFLTVQFAKKHRTLSTTT